MSLHAPAAFLVALALTSGLAAAQENPVATAEPFGRIARPEVTLRCFPTEISPAYEETLNEGDAVRVAGSADNGFVPVRLPLGVRGYVHKDFSVVDDAAAGKVVGNEGEYGWGGAASTAFWVDPADDMVVLFMTQLLPSSTYAIRPQLRQLVQQAVVD